MARAATRELTPFFVVVLGVVARLMARSLRILSGSPVAQTVAWDSAVLGRQSSLVIKREIDLGALSEEPNEAIKEILKSLTYLLRVCLEKRGIEIMFVILHQYPFTCIFPATLSRSLNF